MATYQSTYTGAEIDAAVGAIPTIQAELANKANKDGSYDTLGAGTAENLTPYSADAGVEQDIPFNLQGTGCGNGETSVDTGSYCQLKEKRGNSVVVNQLVQNGNFANTSVWTGLDSVSGGVGTTVSRTKYQSLYQASDKLIAGHKILMSVTATADSSRDLYLSIFNGSTAIGGATFAVTQGVFVTKSIIVTVGGGANRINLANWSDGAAILQAKNFFVVDLTQWFGSNDLIPAHLLSHPEDFGRYYQGSLAYNTGTLTNADGGVLKTIGRNQWDEVWENGKFDGDGQPVADANRIRSKNFCQCIPNTAYYFSSPKNGSICWYDASQRFIGAIAGNNQVRTSPANAHYFKLTMGDLYGTPYNNDVTISLYYEGESGYSEHYAYEELASINTGSETLRSAGSAYDSKTPDGTITRRIGYVDLGMLTWEKQTGITAGFNFRASWDGMKLVPNNTIANIVCEKYVTITAAQISNTNPPPDKSIALRDVSISGFRIYDSTYSDSTAAQFKAAMSGVYLFYELATPTTEQGTPFAETVPVDDFGSMQFVNTNGVPQGNLIFYPVDYKAFVDTAYNELDGDATQIAQKGELAVGDPDTIKGVLNLINAKIPAPPASDGAYKLTVTVADGTATYSWEEA